MGIRLRHAQLCYEKNVSVFRQLFAEIEDVRRDRHSLSGFTVNSGRRAIAGPLRVASIGQEPVILAQRDRVVQRIRP